MSGPPSLHGRSRDCAVLFVTFFSQFIYGGFIQTIGIYIVEWQEHFSVDAGSISIIASEVSFTANFAAVFAGALCKRFGSRVVLLLAGILTSFSTFLASFATSLWHFYTLAIFAGFGYGLCYPPSLVIINLHFKKRLGFVNGVTCTGLGVGVIAMAPIIERLCDVYGWRGALLIHSAISSNLIMLSALHKPSKRERLAVGSPRQEERPKAEQSNDVSSQHVSRKKELRCIKCVDDFFDLSMLLKNPRFFLFTISYVLSVFSFLSCLYYTLPKMVYDLGISRLRASFALTGYGICSTMARILNGPFIDCKAISVANLYILSLVTLGLSSLSNPLVKTYVGQMLLAGLLGIGSGLVYPLLSLMSRELVGLDKISNAIGILVGLGGIGTLIGVQMMGGLYDLTGSYNVPFFVAGAAQVIALTLVISATKCPRWTGTNANTHARMHEVINGEQVLGDDVEFDVISTADHHKE